MESLNQIDLTKIDEVGQIDVKPDIKPTDKVFKWVKIVSVFLIGASLFAVVAHLYLNRRPKTSLADLRPFQNTELTGKLSPTPSEAEVQEVQRGQREHKEFLENKISFSTNPGFSFDIPEYWAVKVNVNTQKKVSLEVSDWKDWELTNRQVAIPPNYIQIKIESYDGDLGSDIESVLNDLSTQYLKKEREVSAKIGKFDFKILEGEETFSEKPREFKLFLTTTHGKIIAFQAYSPNIINYSNALNDLVASLEFHTFQSDAKGSFFSFLKRFRLPHAHALEMPSLQYTPLQVMGPEEDDAFSNSDSRYNNRPAKGYVFEAAQGQRLTTVVDELGGGSFIHSYLFSENGTLLKGPLDTRIEFAPEHSGKYYLVVTNFRNEESLSFKVWIEDRNQTDFVVKVKDFQTGVELFFPYEQGLRNVPFEKFAFLIDFNNLAKPEDVSPRVYSMFGAIEQFDQEAFFPEDDENNLLKTNYNRMDSETIVLFRENEAGHVTPFPDNSQLVVMFTLGPTFTYRHRAFTKVQDIAEYKPSVEENILSPVGEQQVLVIMYNFQDGPENRPFTETEIHTRIFGENGSLNSYLKEVSFGKTWLSGEVVGWYTVPYDSGPGCVDNLGLLHQMVRDSGTGIDNYPRLIYLHPYRSCDSSSGSIGGNPSTTNLNGSADLYVLVHEMGHNLSLGHAHALYCGTESIDNYENCTVLPYGDYFTAMGGWSSHHYSGFHKASLGWIPQTNIEEIGQSGTYELTPIEPSSSNIQTYKIKKPDTNEYYYLEYRQAVGLDKNLTPNALGGLLIRLGYYLPYVVWPNTYLTPESYLLDATPRLEGDDSNINDPALSDGTIFYDRINGVSIRQITHDSQKVTFSVIFDASDSD